MKRTKKTRKPIEKVEAIDTDLITAICAPVIRRDRHIGVEQVGHAVRLAYPTRRWTAAALRKQIAATFNVVIDMPM